MIGVLLTTHGNLGAEMIKAAELIRGPLKNIISISVDAAKSAEDIKRDITNAIKKLDQGKGVLILTDLFGGTPANISLSFLKEGRVEVITGVNLPMLLKLPEMAGTDDLRQFAQTIKEYGVKNISLAGELLVKKA